jgi:threonine dehydrogenase-like Zn-dependent dehydrogenase
MYRAGDVRVENVPDSAITAPTDALVRVTSACICGSDLHPYASMSPEDGPVHMGREFIGIVEDIGSEVSMVKNGDLVVAPFAYSDGTCEFCVEGLYTSCVHGGFWDGLPTEGGQAEAVRVRPRNTNCDRCAPRAVARSSTAPCSADWSASPNAPPTTRPSTA